MWSFGSTQNVFFFVCAKFHYDIQKLQNWRPANANWRPYDLYFSKSPTIIYNVSIDKEVTIVMHDIVSYIDDLFTLNSSIIVYQRVSSCIGKNMRFSYKIV